jgi:hypothetical protein
VSVICDDVDVVPALNLAPTDVSYWQHVIREFSQVCSKCTCVGACATGIGYPPAKCNLRRFGSILGKVSTHRPVNCAIPRAAVA